ncbi:MAG: flagellar hook-associated protein FlgK [Candidatus Eisenbacteria bacterium]
MPGLIQGLEIARRALLAHQSAMNITGHNIANVATEGYTRRRPVLTPTVPETTPWGIVGTGVQLEDVARTRNTFLDDQVRKESALAGSWDARSQVLQQVEAVLGEPSDDAIAGLLDQFYNAWLELSNQPEDFGARAVVLQSAEALVSGLRDQDARLDDVIESTDLEVEQRVKDINATLHEVGNLNLQIQQSEVTGSVDADLRDRRDQLLDQLAREAGATHLIRADGSVVVRLGGRTAVEGTDVHGLRAERYTVGGKLEVRVLFESDNSYPRDLSGELGGIISVREEVLPRFRNQLDGLVAGLVDRVNQIHRAGPSGVNFFVGETIDTLEVEPEIAADITRINAGSSGDPGDNDIALALAALRDERFLERGTATAGDVFRQIVTEVGSLTRQAGSVSGAQAAAFNAVVVQRESVIGVSLDEELTNLVETQKAYEAAARVFSSAAEMIDVLLAM